MFPKAAFTPMGRVAGPINGGVAGGPKDVFLFDLDTLVPSPYGRIDDHFAAYLLEFAASYPCYILTNSSFNDVMSRLPDYVRTGFAGIFASAGTELWGKDDVLVRHEHEFTDDLYEFVVKLVQASKFPGKRAPMLECGAASLRLCLAGTKCTSRQRNEYLAWEQTNRELPEIISEFTIRFPDYTICRDTETSLMILPESYSTAFVRRQVLRQHKAARLIAYVTEATAEGYGKALCQAVLCTDVISTVNSPSDVSQLVSYERRRLAGQDVQLSLPATNLVEA